ncbi:hypothetical protein EB796_018913 [Bugula neritina]|uniref:Uncharacterized protein n=1 Tax=Bugula neritina TaxID=10212 RepID=A0A7J7J9V0_BUGNE|nr:hypothetical protein EB796_018913 [Bugula neritina]
MKVIAFALCVMIVFCGLACTVYTYLFECISFDCFVKSTTASVAEARRRSEKPDINWNCRQRCLKKGYRRFSIGSGICKCIK